MEARRIEGWKEGVEQDRRMEARRIGG